MASSPYTPIACHVYDMLEVAAMKRRPVSLQIQSSEGPVVEIQDFIEDIWAKQGEEFLRLQNGQVIRLDQILALDGALLGEQGEEACGIRR